MTQVLEFDFPETIIIDSQPWKKKTWGQEQDKRVAAYFGRREYLADNPVFLVSVCVMPTHAAMSVATGSHLAKTVINGFSIEFKGARVEGFFGGEGEPFEDLQPSEAG